TTGNEDTAIGGTLTAIDLDHDPVLFSVVSGPAHGTVTLNGANYVYTPNLNFNGADSFTFKANDGLGDSNISSITLTVAPVNDARVASGNTYTTTEDTPLSVTSPGVLANDSDVDNNTLSATLVRSAAHGSTILNPDGSFTYVPDQDFHGLDSFSYQAN